MHERKTIIKNLLKKYNKTYISVDQLIFDTSKGIDCDALHFNRTFTKFKKDTITYYYDVYYFGIRDTLKLINEYIAEIKKSEQYIALMSKK